MENITKHYKISSDKISKTYNILMFTDTHFGLCFNSEILKSLRNEIISLGGKIDFIVIAGDICSGKIFMNDKSYDLIKSILDGISMLADAPIFMVLGNHDLSLFSDKNVMEIIERFMSLKEHSNLYPLSDSFAHYGEININGITLLNESYKSKNMFGKNGEILSTKLASISGVINKDNYNISLIHDPLSVYYAYKHDPKSLDGLDLITSGHLHGGYLPIKDLLGERVDKLGYVEYFRDFKPFVKVPLIGGCYNIGSTCLIVNEGVRRFNGYIPDFISTTPFYSYITLSPEKEKKLIR